MFGGAFFKAMCPFKNIYVSGIQIFFLFKHRDKLFERKLYVDFKNKKMTK